MTLRDAKHQVSSTASMALRIMADVAPQPVRWQPVAPSLQYLFSGTNLFAFPAVLDILPETGLDAKLGREILANDRAFLVLQYLGSEHERTHELARHFLTAVFQHEEQTAQAWHEWFNHEVIPKR